ncbi:MAG: SAM-dependent methyltransferase [Acidimicrobiia bacterium]|nr:SAM-dependent methyltransferase [Acidimicrobiia bacterium]
MATLAARLSLALLLAAPGTPGTPGVLAAAQEPEVGQPGKDVIWVPTPPEMAERMLDLAGVTPQDVVFDLGSGDGRLVIAAAKRGARAVGVEYDDLLVAASRRAADQAGVAHLARFQQGDMYEAEISEATVLALFLLPSNLERLRDKFLQLPPGSRIVINTYEIPDWAPDDVTWMDSCDAWCAAKLWIVPAAVAGTWRTPDGELRLTQRFQQVQGTLGTRDATAPLRDATLRGGTFSFAAGDAVYSGQVRGNTIEGTVTGDGRSRPWTATRIAGAAAR